MPILNKARVIFSSARNYYTVNAKASKKKFDVAKHLYSRIKTTGPITIADYMKEVLVAPDRGYYMTKDVFGETGDFVTSPELGQMFGEMIAIWFLNEWSKMGSPKPFQIVELGPGRGTLCQDMLRVFDHFKSLKSASVELVEISPYLCDLQARRLCPQTNVASNEDALVYREGKTVNGTTVRWYRHLKDVPNMFTLLVAHEFFDALPIHKLKRVGTHYREILVDIVDNKEDSFRYVMSSKDTVASKLYINKNETREHVEISPESLNLMKEISGRITSDGGLALIADYGHEGESKDTFRAFSKHKQVDPLVMPGASDLTADVDFAALKRVKF